MERITLDDNAVRRIEEILKGRKTAVVYYSRKGLVIAEQSTKIVTTIQGKG